MTVIFHIYIHDTLSIWKNTHGTFYILTANFNFMKKIDKNENENFECLTLTSSNDSAIESKKKIHQKNFWPEKWLKISTGCQNQKKKLFKTFRVKKNFFDGFFFWFYSGITWGCRGQTLKIFILIFVCFFHKIVICR